MGIVSYKIDSMHTTRLVTRSTRVLLTSRTFHTSRATMNSQNRDAVAGSNQPTADASKEANRNVADANASTEHSAFSSAGAIGKQFNPDGNIGQIGEKIGGPFSKEGAIGSQFDASKDGVAGKVEEAVGGPSNK